MFTEGQYWLQHNYIFTPHLHKSLNRHQGLRSLVCSDTFKTLEQSLSHSCMRRFLSGLAVASIVFPLLAQATTLGDLVERGLRSDKKIPNQYIVIFKDDADVDSLSVELPRKYKGKLLQLYKNAVKGITLEMSDDRVKELQNDPRVAMISPDYEVSIEQWDKSSNALSQLKGLALGAQSQNLPTGINRINAENKSNKGAGVEVAVIDTGIDTSHPDLKANILGGKACQGFTYTDQNGHGTHVAGTIAALENSVGAVGVAPQAKLWAVRVLNAQGSGTWSQVICGIDWVASQSHRIKVANLSLGGGGTIGACNADPLHKAVCNAVAKGVTFIVAAGNEGKDMKNSVPAGYPEVISVTALGDSNGRACGGGSNTSYGADDAFASFSNYATQSQDLARTIGAPGVSIYSTWKNKSYNTISGTSMAAPHVAGAAALYISTHAGSTPQQVRDALFAAAETSNTNFNGECTTGNSHASTTLHPEKILRVDSF